MFLNTPLLGFILSFRLKTKQRKKNPPCKIWQILLFDDEKGDKKLFSVWYDYVSHCKTKILILSSNNLYIPSNTSSYTFKSRAQQNPFDYRAVIDFVMVRSASGNSFALYSAIIVPL